MKASRADNIILKIMVADKMYDYVPMERLHVLLLHLFCYCILFAIGWLIFEYKFLKIVGHEVEITIIMLTTNILFSWQVTQSVNRLDDIIKKFWPKGNGKSAAKVVNEESLKSYAYLLHNRDIVYKAHVCFTLGVVIPIIVLVFLVSPSTLVTHVSQGGIGNIADKTINIGYSVLRAASFSFFVVGYIYLIRSSLFIHEGILDDWGGAEKRRKELEKERGKGVMRMELKVRDEES